MKKHESIFHFAAETAAKSPFRKAHGAVLVRSGVVLATSSNKLGGNRLSPSCPSTHAEIAALARFIGGNVKQCFEKPAKELYAANQQFKSGFDPPESKQRVQRPQRQRQRGGGAGRGGLSSDTFVAETESCVGCPKQKD